MLSSTLNSPNRLDILVERIENKLYTFNIGKISELKIMFKSPNGTHLG